MKLVAWLTIYLIWINIVGLFYNHRFHLSWNALILPSNINVCLKKVSEPLCSILDCRGDILCINFSCIILILSTKTLFICKCYFQKHKQTFICKCFWLKPSISRWKLMNCFWFIFKKVRLKLMIFVIRLILLSNNNL